MPRHDPFTAFCRQAAALRAPRRADLHAHTTASDGDLTPAQLVGFAQRAKVLAVAVTDHDTVAGVPDALRSAIGSGVVVVPGVELSTYFRGREVHLLGLFVDPNHDELTATLARLCDRRRDRFRDFVSKLDARIPESLVANVEAVSPSLGRRHLASLLLKSGAARTRAEAFRRFLDPVRSQVVPKELLPVADAIGLVHRVGGVASLAHPPGEFDEAVFTELKEMGLNGIEALHPGASNKQIDFLRETARTLGLFVTGGSDTHGTDCPGRKVGDAGLGEDDWDALRRAAGRA
jgi:predicted metal-dependent phosphoesterase TrpH